MKTAAEYYDEAMKKARHRRMDEEYRAQAGTAAYDREECIAVIEAAVAEERERSVETQMLAYEWMRRHDGLLSWIQADASRLADLIASGPRSPNPSPADLPNAIIAAVAAERVMWLDWVTSDLGYAENELPSRFRSSFATEERLS